MPADTLLAPLTAAELEHLAGKLYRASSRALDLAEDSLFAMEGYAPWTPDYKRHEHRAHALMTVMRELRALHAETADHAERMLAGLL